MLIYFRFFILLIKNHGPKEKRKYIKEKRKGILMEKEYILQEIRNNKPVASFVVLINNDTDFYLTYNPNVATRFKAIGDAMRKAVEFGEKKKHLFKVVGVD